MTGAQKKSFWKWDFSSIAFGYYIDFPFSELLVEYTAIADSIQ